jgi:hypothetical protein
VNRRFCQVAVVLLLVTYLFGPAFESIDHWDHFPQSGNDIVLNVIALAACLGAVAVLSRFVVSLVRAPRRESGQALSDLFAERFSTPEYSPLFLDSSPCTLRI